MSKTAISKPKKFLALERILQAKADELWTHIAHQREEMVVQRDPDDEGAI